MSSNLPPPSACSQDWPPLPPSACAQRITDILEQLRFQGVTALKRMLDGTEQRSAITQRVLPHSAVQKAQHMPVQTSPLIRLTPLLMRMLLN